MPVRDEYVNRFGYFKHKIAIIPPRYEEKSIRLLRQIPQIKVRALFLLYTRFTLIIRLNMVVKVSNMQ